MRREGADRVGAGQAAAAGGPQAASQGFRQSAQERAERGRGADPADQDLHGAVPQQAMSSIESVPVAVPTARQAIFRFSPSTTEPEPAVAHVRHLTAAGMAPETIATLGGLTTPVVGMLLRGKMPRIQVGLAERILAIEVPH
ncbi:MAG: hypothetical protein ACRDOI_37080 [Trebonia sp.]